MFFWKRSEKALGKERESVELVAADGQCENGDIDGAGAEPIKQHRCDFLDYGNARLRKLARK